MTLNQVQSGLLALQPELLAQITSRIDSPQQAIAFLHMTCRAIRNVSPAVMVTLGARSLSSLVQYLFAKCSQEQWVSFSSRIGNANYTNTPIQLKISAPIGTKSLPQTFAVHDLTIDHSLVSLQEVLPRFSQLRRLHLVSYAKLTEAEFVNITFPSTLESFSIRLWDKDEIRCYLNVRELDHLLSCCPQLTYFEAEDNPKETNPRTTKMNSTKWPQTVSVVRFPQWVMTNTEVSNLVAKCAKLSLLEDSKGQRHPSQAKHKPREPVMAFSFTDASLLPT